MPNTTWNEARIDTLLRLWRKGLSASMIARHLGGVSRNAVIGKIHRLGANRRTAAARPGAPPRRSTTPKPAAPRRTPKPARNARRPLGPMPTDAPPSPATASPPPRQGACDLATLGPHACRWPIGDPKAADFALCGQTAVRGAYCAAHGARAYRPTPRDHLLKLAGLA